MGDPVSIVFAGQAYAKLLTDALPGTVVRVTTAAEFKAALAARGPRAAFVDANLLPQVESLASVVPIVGLLDGDGLPAAVAALRTFPRLAHLVTAGLLATPLARPHLAQLLARLAGDPAQRGLAPAAVVRAALVSSSARREARLDRMREFFEAQQLPSRTTTVLVDVAEELVTNALYDAPAEAGYFAAAVPRTEAVELPPEHACEISYGLEHGCGFVRIRDPFGALVRSRLLGVLERCSELDVALDESRGGAGLGLWRVFSRASTIAITVIPGRLTDVVVRVEPRKGRARGAQAGRAVHLFLHAEHANDGALGRFAADHDHDLLDESFTALRAV